MNSQPFQSDLVASLDNIEAEQALLGAILVNNSSIDMVSRHLEPEHFFEPLHRYIYRIADERIKQGRGCTPVTLLGELPKDLIVNGDMTVAAYLAKLASDAVNVINARDYALAVKEMWDKRSTDACGEELKSLAHSIVPETEFLSKIEEITNRLLAIQAERTTDAGRCSIIDEYMEDLTAAAKRREIAGVPMCLSEVTRVLSEPCFEAGNLYGLLSSSGEGKTSLTLQFMYHALEKGHPVLFLSFDQSRVQCMRQMVAQIHGIEVRRQRSGDMSEKEWEKVVDFGNWMGKQALEIVECTDQSAAQLAGFARQFVKRFANGKVPLVVVDHIGSVKPEDRRADEGTKAKQINQVFKTSAKQTGAAYLVLNQRNSWGMRRDQPRPISADLYGGDPAKQAYDAILYLYRFKKFYEDKKAIASGSDWKKIEKNFPSAVRVDGEDIAELGALKVRFGDPHVRERVEFEARFTRYVSLKPPPEEGLPL